jgi:signal peptidase
MEFMSLAEFDQAFFSRYHGQYNSQQALWGEPEPQPASKLQKISTMISFGVMALVGFCVLLLVAPRPFGVKLLNVTSGSMRPRYNVGCMVYAVPTKFEKIKVGQDVSYVLSTGQTSTHRVIGLNRADRTLTVQGIHSSEFAETVNEVNVLGVVRFHIPKLGGWLDNSKVKMAAGIVLVALIGLSFYLGYLGKGTQTPPEEKKQRMHATKKTPAAALL